jgi:hypothetical protein
MSTYESGRVCPYDSLRVPFNLQLFLVPIVDFFLRKEALKLWTCMYVILPCAQGHYKKGLASCQCLMEKEFHLETETFLAGVCSRRK